MNALKYILKERGLSQKEFADRMGRSSQNVTRWVKRVKPMPEYHIEYAEEILKVKRKYFIDEKRYCKDLDATSQLELDDYLLRQRFEQPTSTTSRYKYLKNISNLSEEEIARREYLNGKYEVAISRKRVNFEIQKLSEGIKKNIRGTNNITSQSISEYDLDKINSNIFFYQNLLYLRENSEISEEVWSNICKALYMLANEEVAIKTNDVAIEIYNILKDKKK